MANDERHEREMRMNAHFCWSLAMWGSAEASRAHSGYLTAVYAYYYAVFHAGVALIATDHTFHLKDMNELKHSKIEEWLAEKLPVLLQMDYGLLRDCREATSYLGMGSSASKLHIVRGHPLMVTFGGERSPVAFFDAVNEASAASSRIIRHVLQALEEHCARARWSGPKRGDEHWLEEYLQEDVLLTVIPRNDDGRIILRHAFSLLT